MPEGNPYNTAIPFVQVLARSIIKATLNASRNMINENNATVVRNVENVVVELAGAVNRNLADIQTELASQKNAIQGLSPINFDLTPEQMDTMVNGIVSEVFIGPQPLPPGSTENTSTNTLIGENGLIGTNGLIGEGGLIGENGLIGTNGLESTATK